MTELPVEGFWTMKDILGHLTSWEQVCLIPLRDYANGARKAEIIQDYLSWNDIQAAHKQEIPLETALSELTSVRQEIEALVGSMTDQQWVTSLHFPWDERGSLEAMIAGLSWHEREHAKTIHECRKSRWLRDTSTVENGVYRTPNFKSIPAIRAMAAPNKKGAVAPNPVQWPTPCHRTPAIKEAGKAVNPTAAYSRP